MKPSERIAEIRDLLVEEITAATIKEMEGNFMGKLLGPQICNEENFRSMNKKNPLLLAAAIIGYLDEEAAK